MDDSCRERWTWGVLLPLAALVLAVLIVLPAYFVPAHASPPGLDVILREWRDLDNFHPEPLEQVRYLLAISAVPAVFWLGWRYARRPAVREPAAWLSSPAGSAWVLLVQALFVAFVAAMLVVQNEQVHAFFSAAHVRRVLVRAALIYVLWRCCPSSWKARLVAAVGASASPSRLGQWLRRRAPFAVALAFTAVELLPCLIREESWVYRSDRAGREHVLYHLSFAVNEFAAVLSGRTLRVDFFPQYQGVLAYLLAPAFRITGLTVTTFSFTLTALSAGVLLLLYGVFRRLTDDPWKALLLYLPFLWVSLTPIHLDPPHQYQRLNAFNYYIMGPIRYPGPWITAALLAWYLVRPSWRRALGLFFGAALAALNNLDFGLPALAGALAGVWLTSDRGKGDGTRDFRGPVPFFPVLGGGLLGAALAAAAYLLVTFLRSGSFPDLSSVVLFQRIFAVYGFGLLPMPAFGLHWVFYLTFMAAIAHGLAGVSTGSGDPRRASAGSGDPRRARLSRGLLVYSGVFGSGALMYYVGRSHWHCLVMVFPAWAFAFVLLAWAKADEVVRARREGRSLGLGLLPALLVGFGYLMCVACASQTPNPVGELRRLAGPGTVPAGYHLACVEFVRAHTTPGERVGIACPYGFLLAREAGVVNVYPYAQLESLFLRSQIDTIFAHFEREGVRRVFGIISFEQFERELYRRGFWPTADPRTGMVVWERRGDAER